LSFMFENLGKSVVITGSLVCWVVYNLINSMIIRLFPCIPVLFISFIFPLFYCFYYFSLFLFLFLSFSAPLMNI
jgi:hypothetical protein